MPTFRGFQKFVLAKKPHPDAGAEDLPVADGQLYTLTGALYTYACWFLRFHIRQ